MLSRIRERAKAHEREIIDLRRDFHMNPELSWKEVETTKKVVGILEKLGYTIVKKGFGGTECGVVADLKPGKGATCVALRGDMDALPLQEENDVPYKSKNDGVMHACGHDAHTAMLLGAAMVLKDMEAEIPGNVRLIFQPAEEHGVKPGAKIMIEEGAIAGVSAIAGIHVWSITETGKIVYRRGPLMAAADGFELTIRGKGGHGSTPELCHDPIIPAAQIVNAFQTIVSREICPRETAVISLGKFQSNSNAFNIIPETVFMNGTVRTFNPKVQDHIEDAMNRIVAAHCAAARCSAELKYTRFIPATINDPAMTDILTGVAKQLIGAENVVETELVMGSEDFSFFLQKIPGTYFNLGTRNVAKGTDKSHHSPVFNLDEDALATGTALMASFAWKYLSSVC